MTTIVSRSIDGATFTPDLVLPFEAEDEPGTLVQPIVGSDRVDVVLRPAAASQGTMRLLFLTFADAEAARLMLRAAAIFTIASDLPWLPTGFVPARAVRRAQQDPQLQRWVVDVPYREVTP